MEWGNSNNSWYNGSYPNYPPYCTPPPVPQQGSPAPNGFTGSQPPWGHYPPYGGFSYPPGNWAYGIPPPNMNPVVPPVTHPNENAQGKQENDATKINPPLPPDPPPKPPPPKEPCHESKPEPPPPNEKPKSSDGKMQPPSKLEPNSNSNGGPEKSLPPMLLIDPKAPPPPPPPEGNVGNNSSAPYNFKPPHNNQFNANANNGPLMPNMNFTAFQGGHWYDNSRYLNQGNFNNGSPGMIADNSPGSNVKQNSIKFTLGKKGFGGNGPNGPNQDQMQLKNEINKEAPSNSYNVFQNNFVGNRKNKKFNNKPWIKENEGNNFYDSKNIQQNNHNAQTPKPNPVNKTPSKERASTNVLEGDWPESLKAYVGKCFERCVTELDKDQVEICLKGKLTSAARDGTLWQKDWTQEPLINVHSVDTLSGIKNQFPVQNKDYKTASKKVEGDPSRGFYVTRRSPSRSRSPSPFSPGDRRRRDRKRHSSSDSDDYYNNKNSSFIGFNSRGGNNRGRGGRGKNKGKKGNSNNHQNNKTEKAPFYSKSGMTLEASLCTQDRLDKRAERFAGQQGGNRGGKHGGGPPAKRKKMNLALSINSAFSIDSGDNIDWSSMHIVGTSTSLEKQYLRLTSAPDPCTIRTIPTLKKSLEHVKTMWKKNHDYRFACDQLKSIRQDLTVQGVRDQFTIQVYETHCRIALEKGDHEEFNQCQSQLKDLYVQIGGSNLLEFTAYRLLYYIFTKNTLDMTSLLASLSESDKSDTCIDFALKLRAAWSLRNYHRFFKLYRGAPRMTGYLVDWFADRERKQAIKFIIKSYRPGNLDVSFVQSTLAISPEDWVEFAEAVGLSFTDKTRKLIDCKASATTVLAASSG